MSVDSACGAVSNGAGELVSSEGLSAAQGRLMLVLHKSSGPEHGHAAGLLQHEAWSSSATEHTGWVPVCLLYPSAA